MSEKIKKGNWNTRGFISLLLASQFLLLTISGVVRYGSPRGRDANWANWQIFGLDKDQWSSLHIVSAVFVLILAGVHLFYNWRPFISYIRTRSNAMRRKKWELVISILLTIVIIFGTVLNVPPLGFLIEHSEELKDDYATSIQRSPWPHAEEATLSFLAKSYEVPTKQIVRKLQKSGYNVNEADSLLHIGKRYKTSPLKIYNLLGLKQLSKNKNQTRCGLNRKNKIHK